MCQIKRSQPWSTIYNICEVSPETKVALRSDSKQLTGVSQPTGVYSLFRFSVDITHHRETPYA